MPPAAFVLDFDGVVADTMAAHAQAYRTILQPYDVRPSDQDVYALEGARSETIIRELLAHHHVTLDAGEIRQLSDAKQRTFASLGPHRLYPGAAPLVRGLAASGRPLAIVTGTRLENLERMLGSLRPCFAHLISQESYTRDKPHPEPYAAAAAALGIAPHRLVALENATRGVESARAAGYQRVVGLTTTMPRAALAAAGAEPVVATHAEAMEALLA